MGVGGGITNNAMDAAAEIILVEGTCAKRIDVLGVRTIRTVKIVVDTSLRIFTTPFFLLPTINCINGRIADRPMQTMQVPMGVMRTWQWVHYYK
jgi:hypothetical protein